MKTRILYLAPVLLGLACSTPKTVAPPPVNGHPLRVNVWIREDRPDRENAEVRLSDALRDRLADRARILAPGSEPAGDEMGLEVWVVDSKTRGDVVKESTVHAVKSTASGVGHVVVGGAHTPASAVVGTVLVVAASTVAAPVAATTSEVRGIYHNVRLGYKPRHLICEVYVSPGQGQKRLACFDLGPWDVVEAMRPMSQEQLQDPVALAKEEAEALARVICDRLEKLGWRKAS